MKEKLNQLIHLQLCDSEIQEILEKKNRGPLKIEQLEKELNAQKQAFDEDQNQLDLLRKQRKEKEEQAQEMDLPLRKSQSRLADIKNNKEYQAALKEIDDRTRQKAKIEDEILVLMEKMDELEGKCSENEKTKKVLQAEFEQAKKEIMQELDFLEKEYKEIKEEKSGFSNSIEKELLNRYAFLRDRKGGKAVSPVIDGICRACNMGIPPQKFNELIKGNTLLFCPNCQRIIYWAEDDYYKETLGSELK